MFADPPRTQGMHSMQNAGDGPSTMLNLLRFRDGVDYTAYPDIAPSGPISGREAYRLYSDHALPILEADGGSVTSLGSGGPYLMGRTTGVGTR